MRTALTLLVVAAMGSPLAAQHKKKGRCSGSEPDAGWLIRGPIYLDCEVDRKVELRGGEPRLDFAPSGTPRMGCLKAEFEFVVDTLGIPEVMTLRTKNGNDRDLEEAVRNAIPLLRFTPAQLEGRPVRQLLVYKRVAVISIATSRDVLRRPPPTPNC
jgi:hypothetical protein